MEVICDTNIWYNIGNETIKPREYLSANLWGTFISIDELSKSEKLINPDLREYVRKAIQEMIKNKRVIYEPQFFRLLVESDKDYKYDIKTNDGKLLEFTQLIANYHNIDEKENQAKFKEYVVDRKTRIQAGTDFFTSIIEDFKKTLKDPNALKKAKDSVIIRNFIKLIVKSVTKLDLPEDFDWSTVTLFEKTLEHYFYKLETTNMKIKNNDWLDLAFLVYVRPGQKFWTRDRRLKSLIKECGQGDYLFEK